MAAAALSPEDEDDDADDDSDEMMDDDSDDIMLDNGAVYRDDFAVQSASNGTLTSLQRRGAESE